MVTLKDLHSQKNFIRAEQLENQWWRDRGLPLSRNTLETMRYVERLEERIQTLKETT